MLSIAHQIKDLRKQAGLTQDELANKASVTRQVISQIENSSFTGSVSKLNAVLAALRYRLNIEVASFPTMEELNGLFDE